MERQVAVVARIEDHVVHRSAVVEVVGLVAVPADHQPSTGVPDAARARQRAVEVEVKVGRQQHIATRLRDVQVQQHAGTRQGLVAFTHHRNEGVAEHGSVVRRHRATHLDLCCDQTPNTGDQQGILDVQDLMERHVAVVARIQHEVVDGSAEVEVIGLVVVPAHYQPATGIPDHTRTRQRPIERHIQIRSQRHHRTRIHHHGGQCRRQTHRLRTGEAQDAAEGLQLGRTRHRHATRNRQRIPAQRDHAGVARLHVQRTDREGRANRR